MFRQSLSLIRPFSTSSIKFGKKNFKKFQIFNKRGSIAFKKEQSKNPHPDVPIQKRGVRDIGYIDPHTNEFVVVPEMVPEIIVPDLTDFKLKPYVSYRSPDIQQPEFTAEDLFNQVYAPKIAQDFASNKLNEDGSSKEPSPEEKLTAEEAVVKSKQTGSDIF